MRLALQGASHPAPIHHRPTMTDFRALCAELLNSFNTLYKQSVTAPYNQILEIGGVSHAIPIGNDIMVQDCLYGDLTARARAALDEPEGHGLTEDELEVTVIAIQALIPSSNPWDTHSLEAVMVAAKSCSVPSPSGAALQRQPWSPSR